MQNVVLKGYAQHRLDVCPNSTQHAILQSMHAMLHICALMQFLSDQGGVMMASIRVLLCSPHLAKSLIQHAINALSLWHKSSGHWIADTYLRPVFSAGSAQGNRVCISICMQSALCTVSWKCSIRFLTCLMKISRSRLCPKGLYLRLKRSKRWKDSLPACMSSVSTFRSYLCHSPDFVT